MLSIKDPDKESMSTERSQKVMCLTNLVMVLQSDDIIKHNA